ncbi:MAG: class I SAM-dependent methyltransferase [Gaiellaceae bacterium]
MSDLASAWEEHARAWIAWARMPGHDSYWRFHRDAFLELLPPPGRRTLDLGCGEGRLARDLAAAGYRVTGVDASPTLVAAAREADPGFDVQMADAAALPFADGAFDLVVAFMTLQDVGDLAGALRECARVLEPEGRVCLAIVHPLNSAGTFARDGDDAPFLHLRALKPKP